MLAATAAIAAGCGGAGGSGATTAGTTADKPINLHCRVFDVDCRRTQQILNDARGGIDTSRFDSQKLLTSKDAAFKRRARPACTTLDRALTAAGLTDHTGGGRAVTLAAAGRAYGAVAAALADLPPPSDRPSEFAGLQLAYRALAQDYAKAAAAARNGDRAGAASITAKTQVIAALAQGDAESIGISCRTVL